MAISNKGGHGVTNMAGPHHMEAQPAQPNFVPTQGPADHMALKSGGGKSFPAAAKGNGMAKPNKAVSPPMAWAQGTGSN